MVEPDLMWEICVGYLMESLKKDASITRLHLKQRFVIINFLDCLERFEFRHLQGYGRFSDETETQCLLRSRI